MKRSKLKELKRTKMLDNYRKEQNKPKAELWGLSNKKRLELKGDKSNE